MLTQVQAMFLCKNLSQQTQPTNQTTQLWSRAQDKILAWNGAAFYSVQETSTRKKHLCKTPCQTYKFTVPIE